MPLIWQKNSNCSDSEWNYVSLIMALSIRSNRVPKFRLPLAMRVLSESIHQAYLMMTKRNLFEEQLSIKVNFRIHRLEFMKYRQRVGETIAEDELSERILELVIASTPIESYQKELLDKPKGFSK